MELRQLTTDYERQIFANCLEKARATRGFGFREAPRSRLGRAHLMFGGLYALFENDGEPAERMVAGFILHDLATLPQSYPRPDLSHFPPRSVIEGGELWSLATGAGRIARFMGAAVAGILQAKAIVLYSALKPVDLTPLYSELGFVNAGEPIRSPYSVTIEGGEIWAQPLILEGERLEEYVRSGFEFLFHTAGNGRSLRFEPPFAMRSSKALTAGSNPQETAPKAPPISSAREAGEPNGPASLQAPHQGEGGSVVQSTP